MHKFKTLMFALLASSSALAGQMGYQLMQSKYPDPTKMYGYERAGISMFHPYAAFTPDGQGDAYTVIVWLKSDLDPWYKNQLTGSYTGDVYGRGFRSIIPQSFFTVRDARATQEGGKELPNICTWDYDTPLTLTDGSWGQANLLPTDYDYHGVESLKSGWENGCYAINIETDSDLTLVVGGFEKTVEASSEKQCFLVKAETSDRSVSITAADSSATIKLGIGVPALNEFMGFQMDAMTSDGSSYSDPNEHFTGINGEEYQMFVFRAKVNADNTVTHNLSGMTWDIDYWNDDQTKTCDWPVTNGKFEKDARLSLCCSSMCGITNRTLYAWGLKAFRGWLDDDFVSTIRDQDVAELKRRGVEFPRTGEDYWYTTWQQTSTPSSTSASETGTESGSGVGYTLNSDVTTYTKTASPTIHYGKESTIAWTPSDLKYTCHDATDIAADGTLTFASNSTYLVFMEDPKGNIKTNNVAITGTSGSTTYRYSYDSDATDSWQKKANDAVLSTFATATHDSTVYTRNPGDGSTVSPFYHWKFKRLPVCPVKSTAGTQGHRAMHVLSPHTYASATHYGWWVGGTETYVSEDNSITSVVKTTSSMTKLKDWALNNGFTEEEVNAAGITDIVVGRFTEGTVDPAMCPYYMTPEMVTNHFGTAGVLGWTATQTDLGMGLPILFTPFYKSGTYASSTLFNTWQVPNSLTKWSSSGTRTTTVPTGLTLNNTARPDIVSTIQGMIPAGTNTLMVSGLYSGDSGLGKYLEIDGKYVMMSHCYSVAGGPSYVNAYKILKAWFEANGDTMKDLTVE